MKKIVLIIGLALLAAVAWASEPAAPAQTQKPVPEAEPAQSHRDGFHWGYSGKGAPKFWGSLKPEYGACSEGVNQSPIDIRDTIEAEMSPIAFNYPSFGETILNNGHTIQVNMAPGSAIRVDGIYFELKQFHLHAPSENTINGVSYPMEIHLVHSDTNGNLAVVGIMVETGGWNTILDKAWQQMPKAAGDTVKLESQFTAKAVLPGSQDYYRFNGSLTTPPCSEGVRWMVMKRPIMASQQQIDQFVQTMGGPNNRPVQPVNARPILH